MKRLILWLVRAFKVDVIGSERLRAGGDAVERGMRWEAFYQEQGGLADLLVAVRQGYFEAAGALSPHDTAKLYEYALADRLARELDREVQQIIVTGKAEAERRREMQRQNAARILRSI